MILNCLIESSLIIVRLINCLLRPKPLKLGDTITTSNRGVVLKPVGIKVNFGQIRRFSTTNTILAPGRDLPQSR